MTNYEESQPNSMKDSMKDSMKESEDYCIRICVYADGTFAASGPEPIDEEKTADAEPVTSINEALKAAFNIFKSNPVGGDEQAQFDAGLKEESGGLINA